MKWVRGDFFITDDSQGVDLDAVCQLLKETYWGHRRPRNVVSKMVKHSLCFSMFHENRQLGFARAVSDYAVFSWIADVVIHREYRGRGLGKWLLSCVTEHPAIRLTQMVLQTGDAYRLYEKYGFIQKAALMSRSPSGG